jgi:hypothetical protein
LITDLEALKLTKRHALPALLRAREVGGTAIASAWCGHGDA